MKSVRFWIGLIGVLLLAAVMRFAYPTVVEFKHDEATLSILAQTFADGGGFPLVGMPSSVGVPNPPVSVWLMAIPYALTDDPLFATLFVAALNVAGVGLLYLLAYRTIGFWPAVVAGVVYAVNPWAVLYSRKIWAQDMQTPLVLLALVVGLLGFYDGKRWARVLGLPLLLLALQIHFAAWALLPLWGYLILTRRREIAGTASDLLISVALGLLVMLPFALGLARTDPNRLANAVGGEGIELSGAAAETVLNFAAGAKVEVEIAPAVKLYRGDGVGERIFFLILVGLGVIILWRHDRLMAGLVLLWVFLPFMVFTPTWTEIYPHYFIPVLPALSLLVGAAVRGLSPEAKGLQRGLQYAKVGVLLVLGAILFTQVRGWLDISRYVSSNPTEKFGTPLTYLLPVRDALRAYDDVVVLTDGMEIQYDQEPARWTAMLNDSAACVRALTGEGRAVYPAHPFAVLVAPNAPDNPVAGIYTNASERVFDLRPDEGRYLLYEHTTAPDRPAALIALDTPATFDNGAQLTGYTLDTENNVVQLAWRLPGAMREDFQYFVHFLDASGEKISQRDDRFWPGRYWCAGDTLLTWGAYTLPDDQPIATLRVGMYRLTAAGGFVNATVAGGTWVDVAVE